MAIKDSGISPARFPFFALLALTLVLVIGCSIVHNSDYVRAAKADKSGDYSNAARLYASVASVEEYEYRQAAQFRLAELYLEGLGVRRDTDAAIRLLQRAADGPDRGWRAHAYNRLARLYEAGVPGHLQRDRKTAARYYADAAAEGSNPSKDSLSRLSRYPDVFVSLHEAEFRHDRMSSAPAGIASAYDSFKAADYARAYPIFLWHARNGNAEAQAAVATMYKDGLYAAADGQRYAAWTYLAAYNGNRRAQLALGLLYRTSDLSPPDDDEAEQWLEAASKQGLADATNALGLLALYPIAERRKSDPAKALRYFREAADNGSTFALANLGDLFYDGKGVTRDRERAKEYYIAAAERGNVVARQRLLEHFNLAYQPAPEGSTPEDLVPKSADSAPAPPSLVQRAMSRIATPVVREPSRDVQPKKDSAPTAVELYAALSKSVLRLYALSLNKPNEASQGSAVALTEFIAVTNCHVLKERDAIGATTSLGLTIFRRAKQATAHDICLLRADHALSAITETRGYGDLKIGERVYAIGSPRGLENTLSEGLVAGLRELNGTRYIQTTAPITHGSSGGGLFDERGRLIGITTLGATTGNLNFAVTIDEVLPLLDKLR